ncbi:MAG: energy transducer TonB [Bacteroidales bacterium]|jgi:protein TonB|nr:energy transducer TonB [Bacteroidales bacterium]
MKPKKTSKANLSRKRMLFLELGLVVSLAMCLWAFEYSVEDISINAMGAMSNNGFIEPDMPVIDLTEPEPEPEPETKPELIIEEFNVKDDNEEVGDIDFKPTDADEKTKTNVKIVDSSFEMPEEKEIDPIIWELVEDKPEFPGGETALFKFIRDNTKYPERAKSIGIEGRVYIEFVIDKDGKVSNIKVAHGVDELLDSEAIRVVSKMPDWKPGKQRGKAVPVKYIVPFRFKLS